MAPSTPPPPSREELAALTMASTDCRVMSPWTSVIVVMPVYTNADGPTAQPCCRSLRHTAFAALWPDMPCTPGPGGVAEEQMKTAGCGVPYGNRDGLGRSSNWRPEVAPEAMSPPT